MPRVKIVVDGETAIEFEAGSDVEVRISDGGLCVLQDATELLEPLPDRYRDARLVIDGEQEIGNGSLHLKGLKYESREYVCDPTHWIPQRVVLRTPAPKPVEFTRIDGAYPGCIQIDRPLPEREGD